MDGIRNNVAEDFGVGCCLMVKAEVVSVGRFFTLESGAGWKVTMLCCLRTETKISKQQVFKFAVFPGFGRGLSDVWLVAFSPIGGLALDPRQSVDLRFAFCGKAVAVAVVWPVWRSTWLPAWHGS